MALISILPSSLSLQFGRFLGRRWYANKRSKAYRNTRRNLEVCFPDMSDRARDALCRESLAHTGYAAVEMSTVWLRRPSRVLKQVRSVKGDELVRNELEAGRGILLIAPHLGNWEVLNLYLAKNFPITAMYKPPKMAQIDRLVKKMRSRLGSKMAPADAGGVRMVMKALRGAEIAAILPDQEPGKTGGEFAPFFGVDAWTMKLFPQLAAKSKVKVICAYAARLPDNAGFELRFHEVDEAINSRDVVESATAMNAAIEQCVREQPEQYQWEYRRFETRPDGSENFYN